MNAASGQEVVIPTCTEEPVVAPWAPEELEAKRRCHKGNKPERSESPECEVSKGQSIEECCEASHHNEPAEPCDEKPTAPSSIVFPATGEL